MLIKTGIYCIECLVTGKIYIGSSVNIPKRWRLHVIQLTNNTHANNYLQNAWNKHGKQNFEFKILEGCLPEELLIKEQQYINTLEVTNRKIGFNLHPTAGSPLGYQHSEEFKENCRKRMLTFQHSEEVKTFLSESRFGADNPFYGRSHNATTIEKMKGRQPKNSRVVEQISMSGEVLAEFASLTEAARVMGRSVNSRVTIERVCKGRGKTAFGYKWRFKL
jgi:group I intron endonuclease